MPGQFLSVLYRRKRFATIMSKKVIHIHMMSRIWRLSLLVLGVTLLTTLGSAGPVGAAGAPNPGTGGNGLRISPVRTDITVAPGKKQVVNITITNVTTAPATLQTIVNDFIANPNETGNPAIILDPKAYAPSHSLKRFVEAGGNFNLAPGQQKIIPITLNIPANAAGGGYFGAVRFAPAAAQTGPNINVSLAGSVGSLILLKVPGNVKEQLDIASFDVRRNDHPSSFFTSSKDLQATVRFQNQGNIQEEPFGKILLKSRTGKLLASYEINNTDPPGSVLPDSIRKFNVPVKGIGKYGKYKLEGNFGYGSSGQLISGSTTFYVIPTALIILFIAVVGLLAFLVFGLPRLIAAYNRRILRRAGRR